MIRQLDNALDTTAEMKVFLMQEYSKKHIAPKVYRYMNDRVERIESLIYDVDDFFVNQCHSECKRYPYTETDYHEWPEKSDLITPADFQTRVSVANSAYENFYTYQEPYADASAEIVE